MKNLRITGMWVGALYLTVIPQSLLAESFGIERSLPDSVQQEHYQGRISDEKLNNLIQAGERLFTARFTVEDGAGRPMATQAIIPTKRKRSARTEFSRTAGLDANACSSCHHQPVIGGAGDFAANVFVSEGFQHTEFDTTDPQFSNERNTNHLMGAGLVELLAREMSADLQQLRRDALRAARTNQQVVTQQLITKGVEFGYLDAFPDGRVDVSGIQGVDQDLVIRPFSHKGVMTSLRQFTVNALNHHHGMQAIERFGARWTGENDFDEDGFTREISTGDVSALVAWQATLPPPGFKDNLSDAWIAAAASGQQHFEQIGCANCHRPYLPLESLVFSDPGPVDAAGTLRQGEIHGLEYDLAELTGFESIKKDENGHYMIPLFGDLKRHVIADQKTSTLGNELLSQRFVERNVFKTTELWGVGSTAPYGHRGNLTTLREVINAHGGQASGSRESWQQLSDSEQRELIAWLQTMVIEQ